MLKELEKRTDIQFSLHTGHKKRSLVETDHGRYDGAAMRVINLEKNYPNLVRVKVSVLAVQHVIFAKKEAVIEQLGKLNSLDRLTQQVIKHDYLVGFLQGSKKAKDELSQLPDKNKYALGDPKQAFTKCSMT